MKLHFHKVPMQIQSSFSIHHNIMPFGTMWHCHPELELHYIIKGEGVRFIGDNISNFSAGEFVLLGENLPHTWHCKEDYFQDKSNHEVEAVVLHFLPNCMGDDFLLLPEARFLPKLFEKAKRGLLIINETREKLAALIMSATKLENLDRLIALLSILKILSETNDYQLITKTQSIYHSDEYETERMNLVCNYTLSNYANAISLEEIANISNLTVTSFCRYFKLIAKKSYYNFLTEIRISHACRFLIEDKLTIDQIAYRCGFCNISNFYRQFKKVIGVTPLTYKREYLKAE
ncbi:MAG: AraC family transcriptional regulator [Bacteroidota bacterium]|nr:AraC family transcriptional regulator [Bacteroidota bacterium]